MRKKFCMKRTNKQNQRSYFGGLGNTETSKPKKESAVRKSTKNNYMNPTQEMHLEQIVKKSNEKQRKKGLEIMVRIVLKINLMKEI